MNIFGRVVQALEFKTGRMLAAPEFVVIETTNRCNLNCLMCYRHTHLRECQDMDLDLFKRIIRSLSHPQEIWCHGGGEPLLNPYICEMINYAYDICRPKILALTTNGTLLNRSMAGRIAKTKLNSIIVSIDGTSEDIYQEIRGFSLREVVENVAYFRSITKIPIMIQYTVMKRNLADLSLLPELALSMGIDRINVQHLIAFNEQLKDQQITDTAQEFERIKALVLKKAADYKIECSIPPVPVPMARCDLPLREIYFNSKGQIASCCIAIHLSLEGDFRKVNGKQITSWRRKVIRGDFPAECRQFCYVNKEKDS